MLTKKDLQQLGEVVDERIEKSLTPLRQDLSKIGDVIDAKLEPIRKDLKRLNSKVNKIDKTVNIIVKNYDEGDVPLSKRIDRLEEKVLRS